MPNLLTLPFKSTSTVPLRSALREYIQSAHPETHPDAFKWDINKWENVRKDAINNAVHVGTIDKIILYHAQLVLILTKLPVDINLPIPYSRAFPAHSSPVTLSNLAYERVNILYNLAALYCQLATSEDRSNGDGIKRALAHFQNAAGVLSYLVSDALPGLEKSLPPNTEIPADLSGPLLRALEVLMLAQAQECFWQRASLDGVKTLLLAKLSLKTSLLYRDTLAAIEGDTVKSALLSREWIAHVKVKHLHFLAAALYRKSVEDSEGNRYGEELARLDMAKIEAKKALDAARKGGVARVVQDDAKSLYDALEISYKRADRDNDLIYHQIVPSGSSIPPIPELKDIVMSNIPPGLKDPKTAVKDGNAILGELSGWGVRVAIDIYNEKKRDWIQLEILDRAKQLDDASQQVMRALNLPAALDALDRPIGLPPSLLGKAEEVRLEDGMRRIPALIEDVQRLARLNLAALDEALDILDQEATEDEEMRTAYSVDVWTRPASYEANRDLVEQAERLRQALEAGAEGDRVVRDKWDEWFDRINVLCWDESEIEQLVPSSTVSANGSGSRSTQGHARALRSYIEVLDDVLKDRAGLVQRVQRAVEVDDITGHLMREATSVERWIEVRPEIFDHVIEEELSKYDRYRDLLDDIERRQEEALNGIRERNTLFLESRREDPSVKAREHALQSLDLAYHTYRSIHKALTDEIKFYNDFTAILAQLKESCKVWAMQRRKDVEWLTQSLNSMAIAPRQDPTPQSQPYISASHTTSAKQPPEPEPQPSAPSPHHFAVDLPPPNSDLWESHRPSIAPTFAPDLPPPDSRAWETMPRSTSVYRAPKDSRRTG